jgi:hypothetical protein
MKGQETLSSYLKSLKFYTQSVLDFKVYLTLFTELEKCILGFIFIYIF